MATTSTKTICVYCNKEKLTYPCQGCSKNYCLDHLNEHRTDLNKLLGDIENQHDQFRQELNDQKSNPSKHPLMQKINRWENDSVAKIKQTAEQCRVKLNACMNRFFLDMEKNWTHSTEQIKEMRQGNDFNEIDLNYLTQRLQKLQEELAQPACVYFERPSTVFINKISVQIAFHPDAQWKTLANTSAGEKGRGNRFEQLCYSRGTGTDVNDKSIYIANWKNARSMGWKINATEKRRVASGNGSQNQTNQLAKPAAIVID